MLCSFSLGKRLLPCLAVTGFIRDVFVCVVSSFIFYPAKQILWLGPGLGIFAEAVVGYFPHLCHTASWSLGRARQHQGEEKVTEKKWDVREEQGK